MELKRLLLVTLLLVIPIGLSIHGCTPELTPEQKQLVQDLQQDLNRIRQEIEAATKEDANYTGGIIKTLIALRLEVLKTNEALVEQRIHALESGARITVAVSATTPNPDMAAELAKEVEGQRAKVAAARAEADQYSGGLVQAMAETAVATNRNTLAMLEQQYFIAKYGLAMPTLSSEQLAGAESEVMSTASPAPQATQAQDKKNASDCLEIETFDSSVLSTNNVYTELAWKVDVSNSCDQPFGVRVTFTIYDEDEFELDSDSEEIYVPAMGTGKARGKMLVSPPEKAIRMARQGARLSLR